jgi:hypothetical protein
MMRGVLTLVGAAGFLAALGSAASALPIPSPQLALTEALVTQADFACGPGYHLGRGGRRCWPNGWAPVEEIPPGFFPSPREPAYVYAPPPALECPPAYHLGRGLRRCWPD